MSASITLTQSARFDNTNSFYTHVITPGVVNLTQSARYDNSNTFYTHTLSQDGGPQTIIQDSRFDNTNTFYTHVLTTGAVALTQTSRHDESNTFYDHVLTLDGGPQTLTQTARFDNENSFFEHIITLDSELEAVRTRGVPGWVPWVVYINGKRYIGDKRQIEMLIAEFAEEQAEEELKRNKPKRVRIVVKPGEPIPGVIEAASVETVAKQVQVDFRQYYARIHARAKLRFEEDEEEAIIALLQ